MWARVEAGQVGSKGIDTEHLLLGLVRVDPVTIQTIAGTIAPDWIRDRATVWHTPSKKLPPSVDLPVAPSVKTALDKARTIAEAQNCSLVRTEHILFALMSSPSSHAAVILEENGASLERLEELIRNLHGDAEQEGIFFSAEDLS
jgi:ATP-dependent Clp protease ATP-binding subunit ClpA